MIDPFNELTPSVNDRLIQSGQAFYADKGTQILRSDEPWNTAFWLESGTVRMYYLDRDGNEHNKRFFTAGSFFWPVTPDLRERATGFSIEVLTPSSGRCWPFITLKSAFENEDEWLRFSLIWTERLLSNKLKRERELLQLSATERYQALCRDESELVDIVPDHHLASYIGITPVSLSRLKKTLT